MAEKAEATHGGLELQMQQSVTAGLILDGARHWGRAVWLEPGKVHLMLHDRLPNGRRGRLKLEVPGQTVYVVATILVTRVCGDVGSSPRFVHLCLLDVPEIAHTDFECLLGRVNPGAIPELRRTRSTKRAPSEPLVFPKTRRRCARLPPPRRAPDKVPRIPKPATGTWGSSTD